MTNYLLYLGVVLVLISVVAMERLPRNFKLIYMGVVLVLIVILYIGIYQSNRPRETSSSDQEGFKPLAQRRAEAEKSLARAEQVLFEYPAIGGEYARMVTIPAGPFRMGSREGHASEQPERVVELKAYRIDKYEVTFSQFYTFVKTAQYRKPRLAGYLAVDSEGLYLMMNPVNPVVGVSWDDANAYCRWKDKRLPTEAEWEKAARGGDGHAWPWGNEEEKGAANLVGDEDGFRYTSPVGAFPHDRSPYGVYDMAGNAMEWVADWFQEDWYHVMPAADPQGPPTGEQKVIRGASWNDSAQRARVTIRFKMFPRYRDVTIGFRCAQSID